MSDYKKSDAPYLTLGKHLKYLREQSKESLAEVSGAVEIDEPVLGRIEAGLERPAEDILLLLINHFGMPNQEAIQLWELAGYDGDVPDQLRPNEDMPQMTKNVVMLLAIDMRTAYTDALEVTANRSGVTMTFGQTTGEDRQTPVAKLGMSYEQAADVVKQLQQMLLKAHYLRGPKALPPQTPPKTDSTDFENSL